MIQFILMVNKQGQTRLELLNWLISLDWHNTIPI